MKLKTKLILIGAVIAIIVNAFIVNTKTQILECKSDALLSYINNSVRRIQRTEGDIRLLNIMMDHELGFQKIRINEVSQQLKEKLVYVEPKPNFEALKDANVLIENLAVGAQGSGVIIKKSNNTTLILTAAHVIENANFVIIKWKNTICTGEVVTTNSETDLGLVRTRFSLGTPINIAKEPAIYGEHVYTVSNPLGIESAVLEGLMTKFNDNGEYVGDIMTLNTLYGSSGGMVTNNKGELIGIVSAVAICPLPIVDAQTNTRLPFRAYQTTSFNFIASLADIRYFLLGFVDIAK